LEYSNAIDKDGQTPDEKEDKSIKNMSREARQRERKREKMRKIRLVDIRCSESYVYWYVKCNFLSSFKFFGYIGAVL
jgi:hypothetical protein